MTPEQGVIEMRRSLDSVPMYPVRQVWKQPTIDDIAGAVRRALAETDALARIGAGDEIAVTAGSRGIASMPAVIRAIVEAVREAGGAPFVFPAMGSHGGGTAEGQRELLEGLGISDATMGAPVRATMDVVQLGETPQGLPVYLDAHAAQADGIIMANRVKKHTNFDSITESGLCKMAVIGMGKHKQATIVHQYGNYGLAEYIRPVAEVVLREAPILAGLALVENAWGGLADLVGLRADEIIAREPGLLKRSKALSAKIPFHEVDIAVVEWMGKEISGTGMDCYVIGRRRIVGEPEWEEAPDISSLIVLDLTEASHGNAVGVGLADFTTDRLVEQIDWDVTRRNAMTSGNLERIKVPLHFGTAREALETAAFRERRKPLETLRVVAMRDTLHLEKLLVSEALAREAQARDDLEIIGEARALPLTAEGRWTSPF
jgi:hypothetical protein